MLRAEATKLSWNLRLVAVGCLGFRVELLDLSYRDDFTRLQLLPLLETVNLPAQLPSCGASLCPRIGSTTACFSKLPNKSHLDRWWFRIGRGSSALPASKPSALPRRSCHWSLKPALARSCARALLGWSVSNLTLSKPRQLPSLLRGRLGTLYVAGHFRRWSLHRPWSSSMIRGLQESPLRKKSHQKTIDGCPVAWLVTEGRLGISLGEDCLKCRELFTQWFSSQNVK